MIITLSGIAGSGKSTVAKLVAQKLGFKHYSTGDFMRTLAKENDMTLLEFSKVAESDPTIDKKIDALTIKLAKEEDDFVIDSRLAFHFIPQSIKIFLDVNKQEGARRIFSAKRSEESSQSIDEAYDKILERIASERKRYNEIYGFDYLDTSKFDLIVDTSSITPEEVVTTILDFVNKYETQN